MMRAALALVVASACAHTPNLAVRTEEAPPAGQEVGVWDAADGTKLYRRHWVPTVPTKGVLVIMHGLRDHSANYDRFARRAAAAGISVWAYDLRGHGRSSGPRVAPARWLDYVDDLVKFLEQVRAAEPGQPIFVFGHSMGGAIGTLTAIRDQKVAGLILSAPVLNLGVPPFALAGLRLVGTLLPNLGVLKLDPPTFSTDPAVVAALVKDPLVEQGAGPARTAAGLAAGAAQIWANTDRLTMPVLALHGTADRLTAPSGSRALIDTIPATDKTLRIYDGYSHDLLHEPKYVTVEDDVLAWLAAHTGGPASPTPPIPRGKLHGDPAQRMLSVSFGGGIVGDLPDSATGLGELAIHFGKLAPIGFGAGARMLWSGDGFAGALMPLGGTFRFGAAGLGIATGISVIPGQRLALPVGAWLELPLGPLHASANTTLDYRLRGDPPRSGPVSADFAELGLALRLPGDRKYWPRSVAGVGPYLRGAIIYTGDEATVLVTVGLLIYASD